NDEHSLGVRSRSGLFTQELHPFTLDCSFIPDGLRKKPLQLLCSWKVGSLRRLSIDQSCQRFIALTGKEQSFKVLSKTFSLAASGKDRVKVLTILLSGRWDFGDCSAFRHHPLPPFLSVSHLLP